LRSRGLRLILLACALLAPRGWRTPAADRLQAAIESGTAAQVAAQLQHGADPNWRFANGETPLAFAILAGRYRAVQVLLAHGANPNIPDHGMSLLSLIVQSANCPAGTVSELLAAHADPNRHDMLSSQTPLLSALQSGAQACAAVLLAHGANIRARDRAGGDALDAAVMGSSAGMVSQIIASGLAVDPVAADGATPLMWAALRARDAAATPAAIVAILLAHGADPCKKDVRGMTAADDARIMEFRARAARLAAACVKWQIRHPGKRRARR